MHRPRPLLPDLVAVALVSAVLGAACSSTPPPEADGGNHGDAPSAEVDDSAPIGDGEAEPGVGPIPPTPDAEDDRGAENSEACETAADCADLVAGVPCLLAVCDATTGTCAVGPKKNGAPCDDGSACTLGEFCDAGACQGGAPPLCADGNPCTVDACDAVLGCVQEPKEGPCDDGSPCTVDDVCSDGACSGTPDAACACEADGDCAAFDDEDLCNGSHVCAAGLCALDPDTVVLCDNALDTSCLVTACEPESGSCVSKPLSSIPCFDGDVCTAGDVCDAGACVPGPPSCECDGPSHCLAFDDGDLCNGVLTCQGGLCLVAPESLVACEPLDAAGCLPTACDPPTGQCLPAPPATGADCDDGDPCTEGDTCSGASCAGTPVVCTPLGPCHKAFCTQGSGACGSAALPDDTPCDDGNPCTLDTACHSGVCAGVEDLCDDAEPCTWDSCDPAKGCVHVKNSDPCDDDDACTKGDQCGGGFCQPGFPVPCSDGIACTDDGCDPKAAGPSGCLHDPKDYLCGDDGEPCTITTCDPDSGGCTHVPFHASCSDGVPCTADVCDGEIGCYHVPDDTGCSDGVSCTFDACDAKKGCKFDPKDTACQDGVACTKDSCHLLDGCQHVPDSEFCADATDCTVDACIPGAGCTHVPSADLCPDDGVPCTFASCDAETGCFHTPDPKPCSDGLGCTVDDCHPKKGCVHAPFVALCPEDDLPCTTTVCDPVLDCQNPVDPDLCGDGDPCTYDGCEAASQSCVHLPLFDVTVPMPDNEHPHAALRLPDDSLVVAVARTKPPLEPLSEMLLRLDTEGAVSWTKEIGSATTQIPRDMSLDPEGRIVVVGSSGETVEGVGFVTSPWHVLASSTGDVLADEVLQDLQPYGGDVTSIAIDPSGNRYCGFSDVYGDGPAFDSVLFAKGPAHLARFDEGWSPVWTHVWAPESSQYKSAWIADVHLLDGGDVFVLGDVFDAGPAFEHPFFARLTPEGELLFQVDVPVTSWNRRLLRSMAPLADRWIAVGYARDGSDKSVFATAVTEAGQTLWSKVYSQLSGDDELAFFARSAPTGGINVVGMAELGNPSLWWVRRVDALGQLVWAAWIPAPGGSTPRAMEPLSGGGLDVLHAVTGEETGTADLRIVRLLDDGSVPCDAGLQE